MKIIILLFAGAFFFAACEKEAKVQVTNNVHNVRLDNISFSLVQVGSNLLPGESVEITISDRYKTVSFPVTAQLEFYMVKGEKQVYLKTKEYFRVDEDETVKIIINDQTELVNPMN
jgi:hypothetical protein